MYKAAFSSVDRKRKAENGEAGLNINYDDLTDNLYLFIAGYSVKLQKERRRFFLFKCFI